MYLTEFYNISIGAVRDVYTISRAVARYEWCSKRLKYKSIIDAPWVTTEQHVVTIPIIFAASLQRLNQSLLNKISLVPAALKY